MIGMRVRDQNEIGQWDAGMVSLLHGSI